MEQLFSFQWILISQISSFIYFFNNHMFLLNKFLFLKYMQL